MKEELELEKAKAPVIYSGFDFFSIRDLPRHQLKPKEKPLPKQYVITRTAGKSCQVRRVDGGLRARQRLLVLA